MRPFKKPSFTFLIICEGENTEPSFFNSIKDKIYDGMYTILPYTKDEIKIKIIPEPKNVSKKLIEDNQEQSPYKPKRNNKKLKSVDPEPIIKGEPYPLNFVINAQQELIEGTYSEVWVVFDHDNHPARKEAFEKSQEKINGTHVNIAFSSISFEYYFLLHFERIYKKFKTSECREGQEKNKKIYNCNSGEHANDCYGELCIGGYARRKGYWENSKNSISFFPIIKDRLETGFINCAWIRLQSLIENDNLKIYDRDPYVDSEKLVQRLTGADNYIYEWIILEQEYNKIDGIVIKISNTGIDIKNTSKARIIIPIGSITRIDINEDRKTLGRKLDLLPKESELLEIQKNEIINFSLFVFTYEKHKIIFQY